MVGFPGRILTFCFLHTVNIGMLQISRICYSLVCGMMKKKIMIVLFVADVIYLWKRGYRYPQNQQITKIYPPEFYLFRN